MKLNINPAKIDKDNKAKNAPMYAKIPVDRFPPAIAAINSLNEVFQPIISYCSCDTKFEEISMLPPVKIPGKIAIK